MFSIEKQAKKQKPTSELSDQVTSTRGDNIICGGSHIFVVGVYTSHSGEQLSKPY